MSDSEEGFLEQEAEESGDEEVENRSSDESGDEKELEGEVEGYIEDLINDEEELDEEGENEEDNDRPKRRRWKVDDRLDDEDYEIIRENTGIEVPKRKFRRVQMFDSDDEGEMDDIRGGRGDEELPTPVEDIFGGSDDEENETTEGRRSHLAKPFDSVEEELSPVKQTGYNSDDEMEGFIVGEDGQPIGHRKGGLFSEPALLEAQEIFGIDFHPSEFGLVSDEEDEEESRQEQTEGLSDEEGVGNYSQHFRQKKSSKHRSIYDVYEPSDLERSHFTDTDKLIRITDVPERFQVRTIPVQNSEEGELDHEADWIYHQAFCNPPISRQPYCYPAHMQRSGAATNMKPPSAIPKIKETLNFMRNYFFEVSFIATYRREYIEPELNVHDLWKILLWDEKWMQLQQRKRNLKKLFKRMQEWQFMKVREEPERALTEDYRTLEEEDLQRLDSVQTEEELSDVYTHFMLYYGCDLVAMKNKTTFSKKKDDVDPPDEEDKGASVKQAKRRDFYSICQEAGLGGLASKFGLTPGQFGENLRDNYQRHDTEQYPHEPEEAAQEFIQLSGYFTNVRSVLQGACHMVALQIASEPLVRQAIRQVYQTRAMVNVSPTKKGKKVIDENHPCFSCKYLKNKPVRELKGEEFLKLSQAEADGLLTLKISIDVEINADRRNAQGIPTSTYFEEIRMLFYRDEFSMLVEKWNAQRAQSVAQALMKFLYPQMEKELRVKLLTEAKEHVLQSCVYKFRKWLETGGYYSKQDPDNILDESESSHRVMACVYSDDLSVPSYTCFLDGNGEVLDYLRLSYINKKISVSSDVERVQKEEEIQRLKQAISKRKPTIIVVSAESRQAFNVVDELKACVNELENDDDVPVVELMDPNVAKLYAKSNRAKEAFPGYPELLLTAISLGRRVQEPVHEFTALYESHDEELLALKMHPLQMAISQDQLKQALEIELVTKVNEVGVDINFCMEHSHAESMISFVSGFGPRKAVGLLKILRQENIQLQNRSQLVTQCSIGPQVFINCAGFVKILSTTFAISDSAYIEVLDSTRVHPETYEWARKMAVDALEYDETGDESNPSAAVEDVMETPEKLRDLDLDAFAEELQRQEYGNKRATLYDIRDELFAPFKDRRNPFTSMSSEDKFTLLTGETPDSLHEGKLVICTVTGIARRRPQRDVIAQSNPINDQRTGFWQCPFCLRADFHNISLVWSHIDDNTCPGQGIGVRTRLENGLSGFISIKNLSDNQVKTPEDKVQPGMTIHCRILSVNIEKFSVDLTCRSSDLADKQSKFSIPKDLYYDYGADDIDKKKEEASNQKPKQRYMKRVIVHPSFMNVSFTEVQQKLASMDQGEAIFRPSSQGHDRLTLTWKVTDSILQHVSIKEEGKPNSYSLGKSLIIGNEEYEDLDEILARFVQPLAVNAREIMSHKCYRDAEGGERKILERMLAEEKSHSPRRIPYFFSASKQYPGKFVLAYQPSSNPKFELVTVVPEGFRYRGEVHSSVTQLLNWFKEHYKDPIRIPKPTPQAHSVYGSSVHGSSIQGSVHGTPLSSRMQSGQTPYTPSQWTHHTPSPSPRMPYYSYSYNHPHPPSRNNYYATPNMND